MRTGIIDVVEWQTAVDMKRGNKVDVNGPLFKIAREILAVHPPYPGDLDLKSIGWVASVALHLYKSYQPRFLMLSYAQPFFLSVFKETSQNEKKTMIEQIFRDINSLCKTTGMVPVILGTGGLVPVKGYIDLSHLDGLVLGSGMVGRYAGLFKPAEQDLDYVSSNQLIKGVYSQDELNTHFGDDEEFIKRLPDYLLAAKEGYAFKTFASMTRPFYMLPAENETVPFTSPLGGVDAITDIRKLIGDALPAQNIALIIIEGVGFEEFPQPYSICNNTLGWYQYSPGSGQYMSITTGKHLSYHSYLPGFKYYVEDTEDREYPFSGLFARNNINTLGSDFAGRSAAVGTRSILTYMASNADITIECYSRGLYNYGTIAVLNQPNNHD
jgi:hypothetical protein